MPLVKIGIIKYGRGGVDSLDYRHISCSLVICAYASLLAEKGINLLVPICRITMKINTKEILPV